MILPDVARYAGDKGAHGVCWYRGGVSEGDREGYLKVTVSMQNGMAAEQIQVTDQVRSAMVMLNMECDG
jgi:hypothetical protein